MGLRHPVSPGETMTSFATFWLGDLEQVSSPLCASVCLTVKGRGRVFDLEAH